MSHHGIACVFLAAFVSVVTSCGGDSKNPPDDSCKTECTPTCNTTCGGASNVIAITCVDGCNCECRQ